MIHALGLGLPIEVSSSGFRVRREALKLGLSRAYWWRQKVRNSWSGFGSVSQLSPNRSWEVVLHLTDEPADDLSSEKRVADAARSVTADAASSEAARWFDEPASHLPKLTEQANGLAAADAAVAEQTESRPADKVREPQAPPQTDNRESGKPASGSRRATPGRFAPTVYSPSRAIGTTRPPSPPSLMGFRDYLQLLRRRLLIVAAALVVATAAGWVTAPGAIRRDTTFQATHTVIYQPSGRGGYNIGQVALLATSGEVPSRVADRLRLDRGQVRAAVAAAAKTEVSTISITGRGSTADGAVSLADATAEELAAVIDGSDQAAYQAEVARLTAQIETARGRLKGAKNPAAQAAAQGEVEAAERALAQYQEKGAPKSQLHTLEKATASAVSSPGVQAPNSKPLRATLLGGFGLLAGVAGAFALDRLDSRIRSKATAEEAFGAPVVAEIPRIPKGAEGQLLARTQPSSPFVEAYRGLRTYVALWAPETGADDGHRVIVVTSPSPGEGKTTTVAHLAAMLAEIGRSVVVVSADLRRPRIHQYFDRDAAPGLVDVFAATPGAPTFDDLDLATPVRGVRLVASGPPVENPAPLVEHLGDLLGAARGLADFVLVDSPPLLVANDAVDLARHADGVLLVARAGQTPIEAAEQCAEQLGRLEIPVVGTVLVGSEAASTASRHYAARYYAEPDGRERRNRHRGQSGGNRQSSATQAPPPTGEPTS